MSIRLILLVVVAGGLAVAFAIKSSAPPVPADQQEEAEVTFDGDGSSLEHYRLLQTTLANRPLAGSEPATPPEFIVSVSVDRTGQKNRAYMDVSEVHGFYVETFQLGLFYKPTPDTDYTESPLTLEHFVDRYVPANGTLRACMDIVPSELSKAGGLMGADENWGAVVLTHGRVRETNPDPLPPLSDAFDCN